jgi:hypothetical protein
MKRISEPSLPIEVYTICQKLSLEEYRKNYRLKEYPEQLRETAKNLHGQVIDTSRFPNRRIEAWSNR